MSKDNDARRDIILEAIFTAFIVLSPIFFGSVYRWAYLLFPALFFIYPVIHPEIFLPFQRTSNACLGAMALVFGFIVVQAFFLSKSPEATQSEFLKWFALALGFMMVQALSEGQLKRLLGWMLVTGLGECFYGLVQLRSGAPMILWQEKQYYLHSLTGTYLNRNHLAGLLELSLGINAGFILFSLELKKYWKTGFFSATFLLLLSGLLLTGSRGGIACFLFSLVIYMMVLLVQKGKKGFGLALLMLMLLSLAVFFGSGMAIDRYLSLSENTHSITGRLLVWKDTGRMIADHLGTGIGLGSYPDYFPAYLSSRALHQWSHAHNDYLELIAELGLPCFLILAGVFFVFFKKILAGLSARGLFSPLVWGIAVSLTSFLLHSFFDFNLAIPANSAWMIIMTAIAIRLLYLSAGSRVVCPA